MGQEKEKKYCLYTIHSEVKIIEKYVIENRWLIATSSALLLLIYSPWMFSTNLRIDAEQFINVPYTTYGLYSGRPGKFLSSAIFGMRWFNPWFACALGFLLLCVSGILFGYLLFRAGHFNRILCTSAVLLIYSYPIMTTQFYFNIQIFEMAWAYILCFSGVGLSYWGILHDSWAARGVAILCMAWSFGTYQIFVVIYVSVVIFCYIAAYERWMCDKVQVNHKELFSIIGQLIVLFLVAFTIYWCVATRWFSEGSYLNDQIFWGHGTVLQGLNNILNHLLDGITGKGYFYSVWYGVFACLSIISSVVICRKKAYPLKWLFVLAVLFFQLCPFLLTVYLGTEPMIRTQLVYPLVLICDMILVVHIGRNAKGLRLLLLGMALVCVWGNAALTMRLIYTEEVCSQEDERVLSSIEQRISEISSVEKPIALVGTYTNKLNNACLSADIIGMSIFIHDRSAEPHYYYSSIRVCNLARTLGYSFTNASELQVEEARKKAVNMPCWPSAESIQDVGEYVIVKLGEDEWPEEILDPRVEEIEGINLFRDNELLKYAVDSVNVDEDNLTLKGWVIIEGRPALNRVPCVYLRNNSTMKYYKIATVRMMRQDVSAAFNEESLYDWSGYVAMAPLSDLPENLDDYSIILGYTDAVWGEEIAFDSQINLSEIGVEN